MNGFGRLSPWQARGALAGTAAVTLFFIAITLSPLASGFADAPSRGPNDIQLYRAEIERIRGGDGYYDAAAKELHDRGYPTGHLGERHCRYGCWESSRTQ
jgi:hypothetical protein